MKAFRGVDGKIRLFRPELNMARMNSSAQRSGLPTFEPEDFIQCISRLVSIDQEWVPHTESASLYIRPTLIGIEPTLGVASSESALLYTILSPVGGYFAGKDTGGVSLLADPRYTRSWPGGVGDRKMVSLRALKRKYISYKNMNFVGLKLCTNNSRSERSCQARLSASIMAVWRGSSINRSWHHERFHSFD